MAIKLDLSPSTVVVYCTDCTWWSDITTSRLSAHNTAGRHEAETHPETANAREAGAIYRKRRADKSANVGT